MKIDRSKIVQALHRRGQHNRADWVARSLPDPVDTAKNAGVLSTLGLDLVEVGAEGESPAP
jgi:hypothetical protein